MKNIELNHWYIKDNELSISLMRHHVSIRILRNDKNIFYQLVVIDSNRESLLFNFYTLEDAVRFTEDNISKCMDNKEILKQYKELFYNEQFANIDGLRVEKDKIELSKDEVLDLITSYYGEDKEYEVYTIIDLSINNNEPNIDFYLVEDCDGITNEVKLTDGDLENVFKDYLSNTTYEFIDFKYKGGIRRVGYFVDEDTPYFEGIELRVKPKEKVLKKR